MCICLRQDVKTWLLTSTVLASQPVEWGRLVQHGHWLVGRLSYWWGSRLAQHGHWLVDNVIGGDPDLCNMAIDLWTMLLMGIQTCVTWPSTCGQWYWWGLRLVRHDHWLVNRPYYWWGFRLVRHGHWLVDRLCYWWGFRLVQPGHWYLDMHAMFFPILSNAALLTSCTPRLKPVAKLLLTTINVHSRLTH